MNRRFYRALALTVTLAIFLNTGGTIRAAATPPQLNTPTEGEQIASLGPTLTWTNPSGTTQYHLQVIPANNDGPGVDLHVGSPGTSFTIPAPPAWYGLLPGMTYTWRVQVSDASTFVPLTDESWSGWSERHFMTPSASSNTISLVSPSSGAAVSSLTPTLSWTNSRSDIFYYEVQVSKDSAFGPNAFLYYELRHGGVTNPQNSYTVPSNFPLENNTTYSWRVRPRVQGDGKPVAWTVAGSFATQPATSSPTPSPSPSPSPSPTPGTDGPPALTGERIAFVSDRDVAADIHVIRPDGTGLFNLSKNRSATENKPSWSKDGTKLVFVSDRDGNREIYTMKSDGTAQTRVTNNEALDDDPSWSPDGAKITFMSRRDIGLGQQIYVANPDGTGVTRLTSSRASHWFPMYSPAGGKILYGSGRGDEPSIGGNNLEVLVANADGSGEISLSNNPAQEFDHAWSPDGTKVAFRSSRDGNFEIYVADADGKNPKNLSNHPATDGTPVWSPDGRKIAFTSNRDGSDSMKREVYLMNADGSGQVNVSSHAAGDDTSPAWSPDSTRIAFVSKRDGNSEIYVVRADGTGLKRISNDPGEDIAPTWAPR